jgi:hypothetical protein
MLSTGLCWSHGVSQDGDVLLSLLVVDTPAAVSPHSIRRGSITHFLSQGVPVETAGDRMDVNRDVLDKHYDERSEEVKLEQRRGYLDKIRETGRTCLPGMCSSRSRRILQWSSGGFV